MLKKKFLILPIILLTITLFFQGCGSGEKISLVIISGSENKSLEPLIKEFADKNNASIDLKYQGSVDMALSLSEHGNKAPFDAVWPANSIWLTIGDQHKAVKNTESIMRTPVILGVKKSVVTRLGWDKKDVTIKDILKAVENNEFKFAMTSATQSNSGASAYFGFLQAFSKTTTALQPKDLKNDELQKNVKRLLKKVDKSSGSSGWLKDTVIKHYDRFQAMFNYEAMIIEANQELTREGKEPLYAIYPTDGIMIADSPLGFIDKGDLKKKELFMKLQKYLLSEEVQNRILKQGRRTGLIGMNPDQADNSVFNPQWGIKIDRILSPIPTPEENAIREALDLYQVSLRKPSCTAYVLDVSGSMQEHGIDDLKYAMRTLLEPSMSKKYMLQSSKDDIHIIIPFNGTPLKGIIARGNSKETMGKLLNFVENLSAGGGTDIYAAASEAILQISKIKNQQNYFPAVILLTDGVSQGDFSTLNQTINHVPSGRDIPIHSILFGQASEEQLRSISEISIGRVFHGKDLIKAFRKAKGYN